MRHLGAPTSGLLTVLLGDTARPGTSQPLAAGVFSTADRRLRVWFSPTGSAFTLLSPDQPIASVAFALNAQTLGGLAVDGARMIDVGTSVECSRMVN